MPWVVMLIAAHYVVLLEERELVKTFGEDYERYRMYVPALLPYKGAGGGRYREHGEVVLRGKTAEGQPNKRMKPTC